MEPEQHQEITATANRLQAALLEPVPHSQPTPPISSRLSEKENDLELLNTLVMRVDQIAKSNQEQQSSFAATQTQMVRTMQLAQEMIAQQDQLQTQATEQIDRLEVVVVALVRVVANLSEMVAALVGNQQG